MLNHVTSPSWQKLLSVEQTQIQLAIEAYVRLVSDASVAASDTLDEATEKLLRFLGLCLQRKGAILQDLRWHHGDVKSDLCSALSEAHDRHCDGLDQAQRLYATLPYSTAEVAVRVRDLVHRIGADSPAFIPACNDSLD